MEKLINTFTFLSIPLNILCFICGTIIIIWLLILGYWELTLFSIFLCIIAKGILFLLLKLSTFFLIAIAFQNPNKSLIPISVFISIILNMILCFWGTFIFNHYNQYTDELPLIPLLILTYTVATTPLSRISMKEENPLNIIYNLGFQIAYILLIGLTLFFEFSLLNIFLILAIVMLFTVIINMIFNFTEQK